MSAPAPGRRRRSLPAAARARRLRARRTYRLVLGLILLALVFSAAAPDARWSRGVLLLIQSATLAVVLWRSRADTVGTPMLLVAVAAILAVVQIETGGRTLTVAVSALSGVFVVATMIVIARGVLGEGENNQQAVVGAICVYLLLGMLYAFAYSVIALAGSEPLFVQGTDGTTAIRLYFSIVTMSTVGYGDYAVAGDLAHALAASEALLGQLYLVTVITVLVSRMKPRHASSP